MSIVIIITGVVSTSFAHSITDYREDFDNKKVSYMSGVNSLNSKIGLILDSGKMAFVYFYVEWCHFCQQEKPIIDELEQSYLEGVVFIRIDGDENAQLLRDFGVYGFPNMFLIYGKDENGYLYEHFKGFTEIDALDNALANAHAHNSNYTYYAEETAKMAWKHAWDSQYGGYYRQNDREWTTVNDDDKLIAETSFYTYGLMYLYDRTGNSTYLTWASNATNCTINRAWDSKGGVYEAYNRSWSNTTCVKLLGDQAWLLYSLLEIYNRTGDTNYYDYANRTADFILKRYHDANNGGFYIKWNECTGTATTDKDAEVMGAASWALMEWYRYTRNQTAYDWAQETNDFIWDCLYDTTYDGLMTKANADCSSILNDKKYPNEILWGIAGMLNFYNQTSNSTVRGRISTILDYANATMWDWNEIECTQAPCGGWFRSLWRDNSIRDETKDGWTQSEQPWLWYYAYEMTGGNQTYLDIGRRSANWTRDYNFDDTYKGFYLELNRDGTCCTSGSDVKSDWVEGGGITAFAYVTTGREHDIATTLVTSSKSIVGQGYSAPINVTVENRGYYTETFNVTAYFNDTAIILPDGKNYTTVTLSSGESTVITFTWNTTDVPYGNYTISAIADAVLNEENTTENTYTNGMVLVTIPGDVNGDRIVDIFDIGIISSHWYPGPPVGPSGYDGNADINDDGAVDIFDVGITSAHWGESWVFTNIGLRC